MCTPSSAGTPCWLSAGGFGPMLNAIAETGAGSQIQLAKLYSVFNLLPNVSNPIILLEHSHISKHQVNQMKCDYKP